MERPKMVVVVSDVHVPNNCPKATRAFLSFLKDHRGQIDKLILNGDIGDFEGVSSHAGSVPYALEAELAELMQFLDQVRYCVGDACEIHYNEGNHEDRLQRYIMNNAPALNGLLSWHDQLDLAGRNITHSEYGKIHLITPKLAVTHGTFCGEYYAKATLIRYGISVIVGHSHRPQLHTMSVAGEESDAIRGCFGLGCLYPVSDIPYIKGPTGWSQGFGVFYVMPDGTFTPYIVNMTKSKFVWAGKVYA
jgi:UDP-2,3-diacylglucosamine pyrophosphatase LpxH